MPNQVGVEKQGLMIIASVFAHSVVNNVCMHSPHPEFFAEIPEELSVSCDMELC